MDGQEIPVTDLVKAYQNMSRNDADVETRKQQLEDAARAFVQEQIAPVAQERRALAEALESVMRFSPLPPQPDADLLNRESDKYNPDKYHAERAAYEQAVARFQGLQAQAHAQRQKAEAEQAELVRAFHADQYQRLVKDWPEWGDAEKGPEVQDWLLGGMKSHYGFDDATLATVTDHRFYGVARDALRWREQQSKAPKISKKVREASRKAPAQGKKPSKASAETKKLSAARAQLAKDGSLEAAAQVLKARGFE